MKRRIKLTESELKRMIAESVKGVLQEAVLPDYYYYGYNEDGDKVMDYGEDMFPDDVLYMAEKINKLAGGNLSVEVTNDGCITMHHNGTLSLKSLELITKITKYLRLDSLHISNEIVWWMPNIDVNKSRRTQVGDKYFNMKNVPREWQRHKPKMNKLSNNNTGYSGNVEGSGFTSDGIGYN